VRLRFLNLVPSSCPDLPFRPLQIIDVEKLTPEMRGWVAAGHAELVKEAQELATVGDSSERAVASKGRGR
jgi:hypothetical protein